jgi:L-alanine-DL-glutamate epimerase-like enolase superfamily enzyme
VTLAGQVRQAAGREMTLRLDAGRAWEPDETREILPWLARLGIDYLEEPCLDPVLLQEEGLPVALAADESACPVWRGREWLKRSRLPAVFVLKPLVAGGLLPTRQLALDLHARGVRVIITSAFEGQVGLLGAAHLASSLPWEVEPCGFATQAWEEGAAMPPPGFAIPQGPGLGLT